MPQGFPTNNRKTLEAQGFGLDPSLSRDGRIDLQLAFGSLPVVSAVTMVAALRVTPVAPRLEPTVLSCDFVARRVLALRGR